MLFLTAKFKELNMTLKFFKFFSNCRIILSIILKLFSDKNLHKQTFKPIKIGIDCWRADSAV